MNVDEAQSSIQSNHFRSHEISQKPGHENRLLDIILLEIENQQIRAEKNEPLKLTVAEKASRNTEAYDRKEHAFANN